MAKVYLERVVNFMRRKYRIYGVSAFNLLPFESRFTQKLNKIKAQS